MKRSILLWSGSALVVAGVASMAWCVWMLHQQAVRQRSAKVALHAVSVMRRPRLHRGDVVGELEIPRLAVSVVVFEGDDDGILSQGAGHIPGTALAPAGGNIGIAAHRDTYFRPLRNIRKDDQIVLKTPEGVLRFSVTGTEIVRPSNVGVLAAAAGRDLTLVTCYPFFFVGNAPERFIVHARKIG